MSENQIIIILSIIESVLNDYFTTDFKQTIMDQICQAIDDNTELIEGSATHG